MESERDIITIFYSKLDKLSEITYKLLGKLGEITYLLICTKCILDIGDKWNQRHHITIFHSKLDNLREITYKCSWQTRGDNLPTHMYIRYWR